ncbi:MAG: HAD family hydrolase, partial [Acidobacteria bacterium]
MPSPAVFLDKDGTLIHDVPYNVDPALICFTPGAAEG